MNAREEDLFLADCLLGAHAKLRLAYQNVSLTNQAQNVHLFLFCFATVNKCIAVFIELFRAGQFDAAAIAFRSLLESYADFYNVSKVEHYEDRLLFTWGTKKLTAIKRLSKQNSVDTGVIDDAINKLSHSININKEKGTKALAPTEKLEIAKIPDFWISIYSVCSSHVHGDVNAVFRGCKDFDIPILELYESKEHDDRLNRTLIVLTLMILFRSAELMNEHITGSDSAYLYLFNLEYYSIVGFIQQSQHESYLIKE